MKKIYYIVCILVLLALTGCGDSDYRKDGSFTYILPQSVTSLDPQTSNGDSESIVIHTIFEGLCRIDKNGDTVPGVAEKWAPNSNKTAYTFYLNKDACWVDGRAVTADDFLYAIQRALDPATKAEFLEDLFIIKNAEDINSGTMDMSQLGVQVSDEHTITFELEYATDDFPAMTATTRYMPCNRAFFTESAGHYGLTPAYTLTNGSFTFTSVYAWEPGQYIDLSRTVNYSGSDKANPQEIKFVIQYDEALSANLSTSLINSNIDLLKITEPDITYYEENDCGIITVDDAVLGLLFNKDAEYLEGTALREIFMKTIDRNDILSRLNTPEEEARSIVSKSVKLHDAYYHEIARDIYPQQDDSVINNMNSVLQSLELTNGMPSITIICLDDEQSKRVANGIIVSWNDKLSNSFNIEPLSEQDFNSRITSGDYQAALYPLVTRGSSPIDTFNNFSSYASPSLFESDALDSFLRADTQTLSAYESAEELILYEYIFYPISYHKTYYATSPLSRDIIVTPHTGIDFSAARKKQG